MKTRWIIWMILLACVVAGAVVVFLVPGSDTGSISTTPCPLPSGPRGADTSRFLNFVVDAC